MSPFALFAKPKTYSRPCRLFREIRCMKADECQGFRDWSMRVCMKRR